jgi:PKD repeat protein
MNVPLNINVENVQFNIFNRFGVEVLPMSGYSLPFEIFTFKADFSTVGNYISDKKVIWNFGDGTLSNELTGFHSYKYPGTYPVTLTVFTSTGDGTLSTYTSAINISNYINDCIILTTLGTPIIQSGNTNIPILVTRYNSYQTSISGIANTLNLAVSGNKSQYFTSLEYYKDKNVQYKSIARFLQDSPLGLTVVDEVVTTNDPMYVSTTSGSDITLLSKPTYGSFFAGTSGIAVFYYTEDYKLG